jgi:hypothetical protein
MTDHDQRAMTSHMMALGLMDDLLRQAKASEFDWSEVMLTLERLLVMTVGYFACQESEQFNLELADTLIETLAKQARTNVAVLLTDFAAEHPE